MKLCGKLGSEAALRQQTQEVWRDQGHSRADVERFGQNKPVAFNQAVETQKISTRQAVTVVAPKSGASTVCATTVEHCKKVKANTNTAVTSSPEGSLCQSPKEDVGSATRGLIKRIHIPIKSQPQPLQEPSLEDPHVEFSFAAAARSVAASIVSSSDVSTASCGSGKSDTSSAGPWPLAGSPSSALCEMSLTSAVECDSSQSDITESCDAECSTSALRSQLTRSGRSGNLVVQRFRRPSLDGAAGFVSEISEVDLEEEIDQLDQKICRATSLLKTNNSPVPGFFSRCQERAEQRDSRLLQLREQLDRHATGAVRGMWTPDSSIGTSVGASVGAGSGRSSSCSGLERGRSELCAPAIGGACENLFARGEVWLERKRRREKELREESLRREVSECTFRPKTRSGSKSPGRRPSSPALVRAVTPDQAQKFFDRHMAWKQRLDSDYERQRRESREAMEREEDEIRQAAGAGAARALQRALRRSNSATPASGKAAGPEGVIAEFYERNVQWQRQRDECTEQRFVEELSRQMGSTPPRPRSRGTSPAPAATQGVSPRCASSQGMNSTRTWPHGVAPPRAASRSVTPPPAGSRSRSASVGTSRLREPSVHCDGSALLASSSCLIRPASSSTSVVGSLPGCSVDSQPAPSSASQAAMWRSRMPAQGQPIRAGPTWAEPSGRGERAEVFDHLQQLRQCLTASSAGRANGRSNWQRTIRVDGARMSGAGAAPLHAPPLSHVSTSDASAAPFGARGRARSPALPAHGCRTGAASTSHAILAPAPRFLLSRPSSPTSSSRVAGGRFS